MTVYLDLLLINNFCADAALLYCAAKTVRGQARLWRIALTALLGAVLGTGYAVFGLYYTLPAAVDILVKYGVMALLPLLAVTCRRKRTYALLSLCFCGYMFAFAGVLTALFSNVSVAAAPTYTVQALPSGVIVGASVLFAALAVRLVRALSARRRMLSLTCDCELTLRGRTVRVKGLVDTGNRLRDGRGRAVAVADRAAVLSLFAEDLFTAHTPCEKISVHTVSGDSQMTCFRAERLRIYCGKTVHILKDVTVAVSPRPLAGEYGLILPPSFTEEEKEDGEREVEHAQ